MSEEDVKVEVEEEEEEVDTVKPRRRKKLDYGVKLLKLMAENKNILILNIDNVGSRQMQEVRIALRGRATFLMGKNTIIRKVLRDHIENGGNQQFEVLLPCLFGNIGFCFTNEDLAKIRKEIVSNQVPAPARSGAFAPIDVFVPPGPTPLDPGQTAFFQALNIATKISRGAIEIINQVHLIKKDERVSSSAVALLTKLGIKPFFFGIRVTHVYESGSFYDAAVLDLKEDDLLEKFFAGVAKVAAVSLAIGIPSMASLPHSLARGFQALLAIALETGYMFTEAQAFKDAAAAGPAVAASGGAAAAGDAPAAAAAEESDDEDEEPAAGGLFGDDEEEGY